MWNASLTFEVCVVSSFCYSPLAPGPSTVALCAHLLAPPESGQQARSGEQSDGSPRRAQLGQTEPLAPNAHKIGDECGFLGADRNSHTAGFQEFRT